MSSVCSVAHVHVPVERNISRCRSFRLCAHSGVLLKACSSSNHRYVSVPPQKMLHWPCSTQPGNRWCDSKEGQVKTQSLLCLEKTYAEATPPSMIASANCMQLPLRTPSHFSMSFKPLLKSATANIRQTLHERSLCRAG